MRQFKMEVAKKVGEGKPQEKVGEVSVFYPLLSDLGINVDPVKDDEEGFPVYEPESVQYVFDAIFAAVKAQARNKLVSGTVNLKPNNKIAETVEELLAAAERGGEALKVRRDFLASFKAYLATTGKSAAFQAAVYDLVSTPKVIPLQSTERKSKITAMLAAYAGTLDAALAEKYGRYLLAIEEACQAANALDE